MAFYIDLFSPETYERFANSDRTISGFRKRQTHVANRIHPGDKLICYMTKLSRWIGVLEVKSNYFVDDTPIFIDTKDPFSIRFKVEPQIWLSLENTVPIHEPFIWNTLTFTKELNPNSLAWTGKVRGSLASLDDVDGQFLEKVLVECAFR